MKELTMFNFNTNQVRTALDEQGQPWFVAKDVCICLAISNTSKAVSRLDDDEKLVSPVVISGQNREILTINESGLYSLIMTSRKPSAKIFKKWITSEVLPTIRKTGSYSLGTQIPTSFSEALLLAGKLEAEKEALCLENQQMKPKAIVYDQLSQDEDTTYCIRDVAKALKITPQKRLTAYLVEHNWMYKKGKDWRANQRCINAGLITSISHPVRTSNGILLVPQVRITNKGLIKLQGNF